MARPGTFETIVTEIGKALLPLQRALDSPEAFHGLLLELGWSADVIPKPLADLAPALETLFAQVTKLVGGGLSFDGSVSVDEGGAAADVNLQDVVRTVEAIRKVVDGIEAISAAPDSAFPASLAAAGFKAEFPRQLISHLVGRYLQAHRPGAGFGLQSLGVIKNRYRPPTADRPDHIEFQLDFPDIPKLFEKPVLLLENAFGWGTDAFDFQLLASKVDDLAMSLDRRVVVDEVDASVAGLFEDDPEAAGERGHGRTRIIFFERARNGARLGADLSLFPLPAAAGAKPGFALMPAFSGLLGTRMQLGENIAVTISSDLDAQGGIALMFRPGQGIDMLLGFDKPGAPVHAKGSLSVEVEVGGGGEPFPILGDSEGTRLEMVTAAGRGGFGITGKGEVEVFAEVEAKGLAFVLDTSKSDGFISKILSVVPTTRFEFDLTLGIAYPHGVYFRGTSNLELQVPAHLDLGPVEVQAITIAARPSGSSLPIDVGVTLKAKLGPLAAVVENIGLTTDLAFPGQGGNLGPLDLSFRFKPPRGVGLSIDVGAVKGGGYLYIDEGRGEYAGALELRVLDLVSVSAIGIITTKLPDGSKGFSFLAIISAEFDPGLQLGFGFTLLGVGGLVGLNRSMDLDALGRGARSGALDSVLFPRDVVANAPRIISDLRTFFPPARDVLLVGPMAKLGWGTPTLVSLSLGVIIEFPGNIAIVGKLVIAIPHEDAALIVIKVAFIGAIEFDKKRVWFFATLYESRILFMPLDGSMGVLAAFGEGGNVVVSVGGFHPAYKPPPLPFPQLARIAINILHTPVARLRVDAYVAVTSNTLQFGARAELYFGISIANIEGHIAFDALFQRSPFHFIITISASLSVKLFGAGVFSIRFRGSFEGTSPWHIEGTGGISLLFWDVEVDFSHSWGEDENTQLPPIPVLPLLVAELGKADSWTARLENANQLLVSLRPTGASDGLILHPVGSLRVAQRAVPLGITLDRIGSQRPADARKFRIAVATADLESRGPALEPFAIGQFRDMSDSEKLGAADFQKEEAGLELAVSGHQARTGYVTKRIARYEQIIIDTNFKRLSLRARTLISGLFTHFLRHNAAARADISARSKDLKHQLDPRIEIGPDAYVVVRQSDNAPVEGAPASFASRASASEYLAAAIARDSGFAGEAHIVRPHEMKIAA